MGILHTLKHTQAPQVVKGLNQFLKFTTRLAEADVFLGFTMNCVETNRYPQFYWKSLRRNRIYPNNNTLRRHALNHRDTMCSKRDELERNISQRQHFVDNLPLTLRESYLTYVDSIVQSRKQKKWEVLTRKLSLQTPQTLFPSQPERYVHNLSKLQPSALLY